MMLLGVREKNRSIDALRFSLQQFWIDFENFRIDFENFRIDSEISFQPDVR